MADPIQNESKATSQQENYCTTSGQHLSSKKQSGSQNRYAHLVSQQAKVPVDTAGTTNKARATTIHSNVGNEFTRKVNDDSNGYNYQQKSNEHIHQPHNRTNATQSQVHHQKPPSLATVAGLNVDNGQKTTQPSRSKQCHQKPDNYYYSSFSTVDWREQWLMLKEKTLEKVEEPECQRKLIMLIVCTALLLDNMLYMVIVPIIPDYLRSIGAWSTYTENAKWIRKNNTHGRSQWEQVGGQVIYEGEDSAVGFLFASKAIVQLIANPFSGAIADRIGYEIPMMFGLVVMFLSTMVFACGQTYSVLFLARSLQGVGSAFADTPGIAMLADRFTEEKERRRAQGIAIAFISFGCLVAPPFGSVLYQGAGKEVPFIILSLVCLVDSSLLFLVAPPGTFTQLWPSNYNSSNAMKARQQRQANTTTTTLANGTQSEPPPERQQQQQQHTVAVSISKQQQASCEISPTKMSASLEDGITDDSFNSNTGFSNQMDKKRSLFRQKSISRRHSMTVSAGEAPRGTPIEVLLKDKCIACCAGALVVANISLAFLEPTISIWVKNTMPGTEEWQEGMIWLPAFFPHVLGVFSTLHVAEKYPRSTWMIATAGLVIEGLGCLVVPFCSSFWSLIIPISIICFGVALIDTAILPTLGYLVDTRFTSVYGNVYAIADISYSVSYAIGPIIAGGIVEAIGFTALNFLIAAVTLGYTPSLMMLRSIHDYEPFEADPTGLAAARAKPFGQFGRAPIEELDEEEEEDDEQQQQQQENGGNENANDQYKLQSVGGNLATGTRYESPAWASSGVAGGSCQTRLKSPGPSIASSGAKQAKCVKIVDDLRGPCVVSASKNPFLG